MWELGTMMAAVRSKGQPQTHRQTPRPAMQPVLPVLLMDLDAVTAVYEQHWTPELTERARSDGLPPATLADLQCLLGSPGIRDSPRSPRRLADAIVGRVMPKLRDLRRVPSGLQVVLNDTAPVWTLSRTTNALVGRAIELEMVLASLRRHGAAVISGGPGEGKTTVAMEAAARLCAEEPGLTAFALDMRGVVAVPDDVSDDTGERGGLALSLCRQHATETLAPWFMHWLGKGAAIGVPNWWEVATWLEDFTSSVIVHIDAAEQPLQASLAEGFEAFLEELRWLSVRVLVTSRSELDGGVLRAEQVHLSSLPPQHAAELVRQQAGRSRVTQQQAQELAAVCDCNALSLTVVGGMIARQAVTAQEAIDGADHALNFAIVSAAAGAGVPSADPSHDTPAAADREGWPVLTFWLRQHLSSELRTALARLSLFSATFNADGAAAVLHGQDVDTLQRGNTAKVLRCLYGMNAVHQIQQPGSSGQRHCLHPLIRSIAVQLRHELPQAVQDAAGIGFATHMLRLGSAQLARLDQAAAAARVAAQLLDGEASNLAAMLQIVAAPDLDGTCVGGLLAEDTQRGAWCRRAMDDAAQALARWGQLRLAALAGCAAQDARCRVHVPEGLEPHISSNTQHASAESCHHEGAAPDPPCQLTVAEQPAIDAQPTETVASDDESGGHPYQQQEHESAAALVRELLAVQQKHLGLEHPDTLETLDNLVYYLAELGQYQEATELAQQALELRQNALGPEHPDTLSSMSTLSSRLSDVGQHKAAADMAQQALALQQESNELGPEHPDTLTTMSNLSVFLDNLKQHRAARDLAQQALLLQQRSEKLGPEHPDTLRTMANLGAFLDNLGQHEASADLATQALVLRQGVLGSDHPDTLISMHNVTVCLDKSGQGEAAADMARQLMEARQRVDGPEHPDTIRSIARLSCLLAKLGQLGEAVDFAQQALALQQTVLGPGHADTLQSITNLAKWYGRLGQYEAAADMARQERGARQRMPALAEESRVERTPSSLRFLHIMRLTRS